MNDIFNHSGYLGFLLALWIYGSKFNELSETELVRWSYLWIPLVLFGGFGYIALRNGENAGLEDAFQIAWEVATKWTIVGTAILVLFYEFFWDQF